MSNTTNSSTVRQKRHRRRVAMLCCIILLCILVAVVLYGILLQDHSGSEAGHLSPHGDSDNDAVRCDTGDLGARPDVMRNEHDTVTTDTPQTQTNALRSNTAMDSIARQKAGCKSDSVKKRCFDGKKKDALKTITSDTIDTTDIITKKTQQIDTTAAYIYPDPSGGLHRSSISVVLHSSEPCSIVWKMRGDSVWTRYTGDSIAVESTMVLWFYGIDSAGNRSDTLEEYYEIAYATPPGVCPDDMVYVEIGSVNFCIDRYEWPNQKGIKPHAFVSLFQAQDSCFSVGKRLCTSEEWMMACAGPYAYTYPYGNTYNPHACNSKDTTVHASGQFPQCRSFFGAYDMTGNLAEWSNTRAQENRRFYNVMGGFWGSGSRATCAHRTYSYYPQNRHNPVGFRCCRDAGKGESQ